MTDQTTDAVGTQNGNNNDGADAGHDDNQTGIDEKLAKIEERLSKQLSGTVERVIARREAADHNQAVDLKQAIKLDSGEVVTVGDLLSAREQGEKLKTLSAITKQLADRNFANPELIAKALLADNVSPDDESVFNSLARDNPNMVMDQTRLGTGSTGGNSGGGPPGTKTIESMSPAERDQYFDKLAGGT